MGLDIRLELLLIGALIAPRSTGMKEPVCAVLRPRPLDLDPDRSTILDRAQVGQALVTPGALEEVENQPALVGEILLDLALQNGLGRGQLAPAVVALLHRS